MSARSRPVGIKLHKAEQSIRIGISFEKEDVYTGPGALVRAIHPYGLATQAGLKIGDVVLSINGKRINSPLVAASTLRESDGDIWLSVQRDAAQQRAPGRDGPGAMREELGVPALPVGRAAAWKQARTNGDEEENSFDLGQMSARAMSSLTTFITGKKEEASSPSKAAERLTSALGAGLSKFLNPKEHQAATMIAAAYRAHVTFDRYNEERGAALAMQAAARRQLAVQAANMHRVHYWAAVEMQKWVRGFIDRTWVRMVREEVHNLHQAQQEQEAEEAEREAQARYEQKTNKRDKVKRAFSFNRKQQRSKPSKAPDTPSARDLLRYGGHIGASGQVASSNAPAPEEEAPSTPGGGGTLGSLKRSFSWGRRSKADKESRRAEKENCGEATMKSTPATTLKRTFSWSRSKSNA